MHCCFTRCDWQSRIRWCDVLNVLKATKYVNFEAGGLCAVVKAVQNGTLSAVRCASSVQYNYYQNHQYFTGPCSSHKIVTKRSRQKACRHTFWLIMIDSNSDGTKTSIYAAEPTIVSRFM